VSALAASQHDAEAFAVFYDTHANRVLGFFRRRAGNAEVAFDLFAETFAKALERRHQFRGSTFGEEQAWLFAIARSELLHYWRDSAIETAAVNRLGVEIPPLTDPDIERIDELASLPRDIEAALRELPETQRRAVELRVVHEATYEDVSEALGISTQTARTRVSRGLRALGKDMRPVADAHPAA
jgi:RNA polymerase sigma factor (sigma-70 family)